MGDREPPFDRVPPDVKTAVASTPPEPVQRIEIDGVPVFWLPDGRRQMASLQFRVGRSDETFVEMGITHLVEHLAMFRLGQQPYDTNASVDNLRTVFHVTGTSSNIVEFLHGVVAALRALPLDRLADESRILRTEAMQRTPTIGDLLVSMRYGRGGHGSVNLPEFGLGSLSEAAVAAWSEHRFTAGNAALWIAGALPEGLRLDLAAGPRHSIAAAVPIPELPLPAWARFAISGVAMGLPSPRTSASTMGNQILRKRLERHLRYDLGRSYGVSIEYEALDAQQGHSSFFASCLDADVPRVRAAFLATVDELVRKGPTEAELAEACDGFRRNAEDPDAGYDELGRAIHDELTGHPQMTNTELLAEMRAVRPADLQSGLEIAVDRAIMFGPLYDPPEALGRIWSAYPQWSTTMIDGIRFDRATRKYPWSPRTDVLILGGDAISWMNLFGQATTVRYADCIGLVIDIDGTRTIYGRDGGQIRVNASEWKQGQWAVDAIDAAVPAQLVVRVTAM